jgi:hypothetical protein
MMLSKQKGTEQNMTAALEDENAELRRANAELRQRLDERTAELELRTAERDEALAQQTATAEVLQVINSSPGELATVFDAMLQRTLHLCDASCASLAIYDGECFDTVVSCGHPQFDAWLRQFGPIHPGPGSTMARMLSGERVAQVADITIDADVAAPTRYVEH